MNKCGTIGYALVCVGGESIKYEPVQGLYFVDCNDLDIRPFRKEAAKAPWLGPRKKEEMDHSKNIRCYGTLCEHQQWTGL